MMKKIVKLPLLVLVMVLAAQQSFAHCEVPCGIYEDTIRVELIKEHISTIEKAMNQINAISGEKKPNYNQLIRWTVNKEEHAKKIQEIVSQYFLHQRIKVVASNSPSFAKYQKQLSYLHQLLVYAMKTKQTTDLSYIEKLRKSLHSFEHTYFHNHSH